MSERPAADAQAAANQAAADAQNARQAASDAQAAADKADERSRAAERAADQAEAPTTRVARPSRYDSPVLRSALIALLALAGLLIVGAFLWNAGLLRWAGLGVAATPTRELILQAGTADTGAGVLGAGGGELGAGAVVPPPGAAPGPPPSVSGRFQAFYDGRGGSRVLGNPISAPLVINGREVQWFERGRLEHWPEFAGTPYEVQLGRVGVEYTAGREFAKQSYFVSQPGLRFFPETSHAVGGVFLNFWEQNGGLDSFGLPISEEMDEVLPDGRAYRVQYFERTRMEYHSDFAGTPYEIQLGLLGTALLRNESRPNGIQPAPTTVPLP